MKRPAIPILLPTGTARQSIAARPAYSAALIELARQSDLDESGVYLAWQVAQLARDLAPDERDAFMLLVGRLLVAQSLGSTRLATSQGDPQLLAKLPDLVQSPAVHAPFVLDGKHLYTERAHGCETRVASHLAAMFAQAAPFSAAAIARALDEVAAHGAPAPTDEQKGVVAHALAHSAGVISGGPGTGKTTTALALVRCLVRLGLAPTDIALCAPTGKAASRLEDDFRTRLAAWNIPPQATAP